MFSSGHVMQFNKKKRILEDEVWGVKKMGNEASAIYPPNPYRVLPWRLSAYTTSMAVTVLRRACSV